MKHTLFYRSIFATAFLILAGIFGNCKHSESKEAAQSAGKKQEWIELNHLKAVPFSDTLEVFIDSTEFGRKGKNRIELRIINTETVSRANMKLYTRNGQKFELSDEITLPDVSILGARPVVADFNADHLNDLRFHSADAARGANEPQTLIVFDPVKNKLIQIKNSESFPNLEYNTKLHCISAWSVYGGEMTHFLRLVKDSLMEFASVEHFDGRIVVRLTDTKGEIREIKNISEKSVGCDFCRFTNYNPIEVYE